MTNDEQKEPVSSLSGYLERVKLLRDDWKLADHKELWFRAEKKKFASFLSPNLYRPEVDLLTEKVKPLRRVEDILEMEDVLYEKFIFNLGTLTDEKPDVEDEEWGWYNLMQHHFAPTRLLDWTDGSLIALYFAVYQIENKDKCAASDKKQSCSSTNVEDAEDDNPRVWVIEPDRMQDLLDMHPESYNTQQRWKEYLEKNPDLKYEKKTVDDWDRAYLPTDKHGMIELPIPQIPLLLNVDRISRRIAAQRSQFILFGSDPHWLAELSQKSYAPIKKIVIAKNSAYKLRCELKECGISNTIIFPDLDGLGKELLIQFKDLIYHYINPQLEFDF